jgi:hypothetical protein
MERSDFLHLSLFIRHSKQFCLTPQNGDQAEIVGAPKVPIAYLGTGRLMPRVKPGQLFKRRQGSLKNLYI